MCAENVLNPLSLAQPAWLRDNRFDSLIVEVYELALVPDMVPRKVFRFSDIVVAIKTSRLRYLEIAGVKIAFGDKRQVKMAADHKISVSEYSPKLLTIQPHSRSRPDDERKLLNRSSEYVSLLIATNYRNIAFRHLFTQTIGIRDDSLTMAGNMFRLPFDLPPPDLSASAMARYRDCWSKIDALPKQQKRKVRLSLRWHLKGIQSDNLDSFLSLWVALETLIMNSTNIIEINNALAAAYGISSQEARKEFGVGKIYGLRSDIVHNGLHRTISSDLTDYMECLYADLLQSKLLGASVGRSRAFIARKSLDIEYLTSAEFNV